MKRMGFLPDNYEAPATGNYMRLDQGDNKIRIMGPAIVGNEFWTSESDGSRKPIRRRIGEKIDDYELGVDQHGKREKVKHFWAMPVWDYKTNSIQILELTQRTVMNAIEALYRDTDWGDPSKYDLKISKSGSGLDTEYRVTPLPKSPQPQAACEEMATVAPNLQALFDGGDPFAATAGDAPVQAEPVKDDGVQMATETIHSVEQKGKWLGVKTTTGMFVTDDENVAEEIKSFGRSEVAFTFNMRNGRRYILSAAPSAEPVAAGDDEEDIPF
jgi:hypothetical protein